MQPLILASVRVILSSLLLATPALAQQAPPPGQRAWAILYQREVGAHQIDLATAVEYQDLNTALTKRINDLTKQTADQAANVTELTKELAVAKSPPAVAAKPGKTAPK
jgi:hypothetical protein